MLMRDGTRLVTVLPNGPTVIRDARTLRPLKRLPVAAERAALSPDDRTHADRPPRRLGGLRRPRRPARCATAPDATTAPSSAVAFSADGRTAVSAGEDNRVIVWDVERGLADGDPRRPHRADHRAGAQPRRTHPLHRGARRQGADLGPRGRPPARPRVRLRPGQPGRDPARGAELAARAANPCRATPLSPDGRLLASGQDDGTVKLTDVRTLREISQLSRGARRAGPRHRLRAGQRPARRRRRRRVPGPDRPAHGPARLRRCRATRARCSARASAPTDG